MKIEDIEIEKLIEIIQKSKSKREVIRKLGWSSHNGNQLLKLSQMIDENKINIDHFYENFNKKFDLIKDVIKECNGIIEIAEKIGLPVFGRSAIGAKHYLKIKKYIKMNNLDISHFKYNRDILNYRKVWKDEDIFKKDSNVNSITLKKRYLKRVEYKCFGLHSNCEIFSWHGKALKLQLDHINGIRNDNRLDNLRLLCPNCHSQTETYCRVKRNS